MGTQELSLGGKSAVSEKTTTKKHVLLDAESFYSRPNEAQCAFYFITY